MAPRIALYGAGGAPYNHAAVFARAGYEVDFVFPQDVLNGVLAGFDAFVMPGGGYRAMIGQIEPLGREGARALREYVEAGGMYIGCCAGSYDAATVAKSFLELCPAQEEMCLSGATVWNDGGEEWGLRSPGIGVLRAETVAARAPRDGRHAGDLRDRALQRSALPRRNRPGTRRRTHGALHSLGGDARPAGGAAARGRRRRGGSGEHRRGRRRRRASPPLRVASGVRVHDRNGGRATAGAHAPERR